MKKTLFLASCFVVLGLSNANAQFLGFGRNNQDNAVVETKKTNITKVDEVKDTATSAMKSKDAEYKDDTDGRVEVLAFPVEVTKEEKDKIDANLRDDLRDSVKNDDIKARVQYLDIHNYLNRIELREKMLQNNKDFDVSDRISKDVKKVNVNPKDNDQMNEFIFEQADVAENTKENVNE